MKELLLHIGFTGTLLSPLLCVIVLSLLALFKRPIVEERVSKIARAMSVSYLFFTTLLLVSWLFHFQADVKWEIGSLYNSGTDEIDIALFLDRAGVVFLGATSLIANVIILFSRRYLHRDPGFRRFYLVLSLFLFGMTLLFCAGSFDLIFASWEIIGLSSFLLIGFYWHRPAAVINAKRAYFIYRTCDVGLLAGALMSHLIWHDTNLFYDLTSGALLESWDHVPLFAQWTLSMLILLPVIGKSAQFPVSYWLPKAMEGPTPSSAIFYGSISIHAGVFLLIRTSSIWVHTPGFTWVLAVVGILTAVSATLFGRVQASIKAQIGYASVAQVGLMLVELSFGFYNLVLIHFMGNAFLRCFQLLVSASIVAEQLQIHGALEGKHLEHRWSMEMWIPKSWRTTLYVFALNEGYLEPIMSRLIARNVERLAKLTNQFVNHLSVGKPVAPETVTLRSTSWFPVISLGLYGYNLILGPTPFVPILFLALSVFLALNAFGERQNPLAAIRSTCFSHLALLFALTINHLDIRSATLFYLVGFAASWLLVYDAYSFVLRRRVIDSRRRFEGLFAQFPLASAVGLVGILGLVGFPLATTFFAEDLLLEHAVHLGILFVAVPSVIFILNGATLIRLHSRLFFGARELENTELDLDYSTKRAFASLALFLIMNVLAFALI